MSNDYNTIQSYEYDADIHGFTVTFKNGSVVQTEFDKETNTLRADCQWWSLEKYKEFNIDQLSKAEERELYEFINFNRDVKMKEAELDRALLL